jgi:hypothetical protein
MGGKWLQLLTEIAPGVRRAAIMFNPETSPRGGLYYLPLFEAAARSQPSIHHGAHHLRSTFRGQPGAHSGLPPHLFQQVRGNSDFSCWAVAEGSVGRQGQKGIDFTLSGSEWGGVAAILGVNSTEPKREQSRTIRGGDER